MPVKFAPFTDGFQETGNQVHDWVKRRAGISFAEVARNRLAVIDQASFEAYREGCRQRFLETIGGLPTESGDLEVRETGRLVRAGYTVRRLIYQSLPSFYVPGNLYQPDPVPARTAAVLMVCGHSSEGKAAPKYQRVCINLVQAGFTVLIIDSFSHGELVQCLDPVSGQAAVGLNTREHSHLQLSASVLGCNILRYFIWNAIRGIDLLCSLPEVDQRRIGVTGNSGGGHLTQALMMVEPRVQAAMPGCSLTTREKYLETGVRAYDGEQNFFGCIPNGLDYDDFLACFAPRPVRVGAAAHDYFAIEGVLEAVERARRIYRVLGVEEKLDLRVAADEQHGYSLPLRQGCVEWFTRYLQDRQGKVESLQPEVEREADLQCTESGQVMSEFPDARSVLDLQQTAWRALRSSAPAAGAAGGLGRTDLRQRLGLSEHIEPPAHVRCTSRITEAAIMAERLFFFSEPGITCTAVVYRPLAESSSAATLLLLPDGTEGQEKYRDRIGELTAAGRMVMVFDPRGTGAVRMRQRNPATGLQFRSTEFRVANDHFMLGTSIAARRVFDLLRGLAYLRSRPELGDQAEIDLLAVGWPAIYGLLAAAVDGNLNKLALEGLPKSWEMAFCRHDLDPEECSVSLLVPELRGFYDIPDLMAMGRRRG